jgi:hypothetical protein
MATTADGSDRAAGGRPVAPLALTHACLDRAAAEELAALAPRAAVAGR